MNQKQQINFFSDVQISDWIINDIQHLQEPQIINQGLKNQSIQDSEKNKFTTSIEVTKRRNPVSYEIDYWNKNQQNSSQEDQNINREQRKQERNKKQKKCLNSKKYRQKKKQYFKSLEQENRFLKFKIDQLNFRLNQAQMQLNRLKNGNQIQTKGYYETKLSCIKQIQQALQRNQKDVTKLLQIQARMQQLNNFDGKQKLDLLNYFMSQLLQNVITDRIFYFIDSLISKKGIHRENQNFPLRRIDKEVVEILRVQKPQKLNLLRTVQKQVMEIESKKFQQLWKKLYQVYLAILNQGFKMTRLVKPLKEQLRKTIQISDFLRLQLHFQKNKQRSDIRQMRSSWFKQLQKQSMSLNEINKLNPSKRNKN